jgi:hypothetical protein
MHWQIGIDEAGYGPNLGPFVMVGVGFRSSQAASLPLWEALAPGVGRADAPAHRLAVDDSKRIYTSGSRRGLQRLEAATLAFPWEADGLPTTCAQLLQRIAAESLAGLAQEPSFQPDTALPHWADPDRLSTQTHSNWADYSTNTDWPGPASPRSSSAPASSTRCWRLKRASRGCCTRP